MKLKKSIPLIDQHNQQGFWGGKFGGSFIPETLKKPVEDLTKEFKKLRNDKRFLKKRDYYFKNYKNLANFIDLSGGVETSGLKDLSKIEFFLNKVNEIKNET